MSKDLKKFTPFDKGIRLVSRPSDIDEFDDDPGVLRAQLSCGHVIDPETLTDCCRAQLNDGRTEFRCPLCGETWPYDEVRKLAKLTLEEQLSFEEKLGTNTAKKIVDFKDCPGCGAFIERSDGSNLCVECSVCTATTGRVFEFCWMCERPWRGPRPRADQCGNAGCRGADRELLGRCPEVALLSVVHKGTDTPVRCPAIRACPFCGVLIEHNKGCKIMSCSECKQGFCFACLRSARDCLKTSTHFIACSAPVAPRQNNSVP
ncbi:probable E3 ubiquitin-protein ligase ARI7 [Puntigrus tetrazona]|uniref:probable E3 ubiquitin-protein ligase ARI7 n=1 Tax=Puntigrus tetrazona TaxID=1606681 RepID=UPI001C8972F3|nr:probable E3 ubiquitin-protein ligase ARI7 [Puntigrus tetrazona]